MKDIRLLAPRLIDGVVRYPVEGILSVDDDLAQQFINEKAAVDPEAKIDDGLEAKGMTEAKLREIAEQEGVSVEDDANKATIIQAIRAHREGAGG